MKDKKFVIGVFVVTALLLAGGVYAAMNLSASPGAVVEQVLEAKANIVERAADFGEVPLDGGNVVKVFTVENTGEGELTLANFTTSCMCTTVKVKTAAGESIDFGMHTKSKWQGKISPGEKGEVVVTFDPAFHGPSGKGSITRMVKFETNDSDNQEIELMMTGKVI